MAINIQKIAIFTLAFLLEISAMLGATTIANIGGIIFNLLGSLLVIILSSLILYGLDQFLYIMKVPVNRKNALAIWGWNSLNNNRTAVRMVAFSIGIWCTFVFIAPVINATEISYFNTLLQSVNSVSARLLSMIASCMICAVIAGAFDKNAANFSIAGVFLPFISPLALAIFLQDTRSKASSEVLEDEFYNVFQEKTFEMMGTGYDISEIPKLATNKAAEIIMKKHGIAMPDMVKIIKNAIQKK